MAVLPQGRTWVFIPTSRVLRDAAARCTPAPGPSPAEALWQELKWVHASYRAVCPLPEGPQLVTA